MANECDGGREQKRNQEQKSDHQDKAERENAILNDTEDPSPGLGLNTPDRVQGRLQLPKNARCAKEKRREPYERRGKTGRRFRAGILHHNLHRSSTLIAQQTTQLIEDLALSGFLAEDQARDGNGYNQHRSEREDGLIRESGAQRWRLILHPLRKGLLQDRNSFLHAHFKYIE